ncbi:MAG: SIMPL domain-containing protein, partial [Isosphaeraceae bacterium]
MIGIISCILASPTLCQAQVGGNVSYAQGGGRNRAEQEERSKRVLSKEEMPPTASSMFVEANVLMNVRADRHVAVFGIVREGETLADCGRKMDGTIKQFTDELKRLGIGRDDLFVDFIAQNRTYGYDVAGNIAREKLVGFELKKNVSIHYRDRTLLDKLVITASQSRIHDLIKVDDLVSDTGRIDDRLMDEAGRVIKHKTSRH